MLQLKFFFDVNDLQNLVHSKLYSMLKHYASKTVSIFLEENICVTIVNTASQFGYAVIYM